MDRHTVWCRWIVVSFVFGLAASGCRQAAHRATSANTSEATRNSASTTAETPSTTTTGIPNSAGVGNGLTGFGASVAQWNAHHSSDGGTDYGPTFSLLSGSQHEWTAATPSGGRIVGYTRAMPQGTSIAAAKQAILDELPSDATTGLYQIETNCAIWGLQSSTITAVLGPQPWGDTQGQIGVVLYSLDSGGNKFFDPNDVEQAEVALFWPDPHMNC